MRRIATGLSAALVLTIALAGCQNKKKKAPEYEVQNLGTDSYSASATSGAPSSGYNAYSAEPGTTNPSEPSGYPADPYGSSAAASGGDYAAGGARYHTVAKGDTLYRLARMYYNDQARWKDIYEQNRSQISDPNRIRVGQRLVIP